MDREVYTMPKSNLILHHWEEFQKAIENIIEKDDKAEDRPEVQPLPKKSGKNNIYLCSHNVNDFISRGSQMIDHCTKFVHPTENFANRITDQLPGVMFGYFGSMAYNGKRKDVFALLYNENQRYAYIEETTALSAPRFLDELILVVWDRCELAQALKYFPNAKIYAIRSAIPGEESMPTKTQWIRESGIKYHFEIANSNWETFEPYHAGLLYQNLEWVRMWSRIYWDRMGTSRPVPTSNDEDAVTAFNLEFQKIAGTNPDLTRVYPDPAGFRIEWYYGGRKFSSVGASKKRARGNFVKMHGDTILARARELNFR
jgi:hypothetical protein